MASAERLSLPYEVRRALRDQRGAFLVLASDLALPLEGEPDGFAVGQRDASDPLAFMDDAGNSLTMRRSVPVPTFGGLIEGRPRSLEAQRVVLAFQFAPGRRSLHDC